MHFRVPVWVFLQAAGSKVRFWSKKAILGGSRGPPQKPHFWPKNGPYVRLSAFYFDPFLQKSVFDKRGVPPLGGPPFLTPPRGGGRPPPPGGSPLPPPRGGDPPSGGVPL